MTTDIDSHLDVCGVCCPMPIIRLAKSIRELKPGQTIEITGNDPIFESSVREFCRTNGHAVLDVTEADGRRVSVLIKAGG